MNNGISLDNLILSVLLFFIGVKLLFDGWIMLKQRRLVLTLPQKVGLLIVQLLKGQVAENGLRAKLNQPETVRKQGVDAIKIGLFILLCSTILFISSIKTIFNRLQ